MEAWLLNWSSFLTRNTHSEIEGITYESGDPEWFSKLFEKWKKESDLGRELGEKEERSSMIFKLDSDEFAKLKKWQSHIKAIYGQYGDYTYSFESGGGMGVIKKVWSDLAKVELDLTDIDKW
jgi:hypothetical protein